VLVKRARVTDMDEEEEHQEEVEVDEEEEEYRIVSGIYDLFAVRVAFCAVRSRRTSPQRWLERRRPRRLMNASMIRFGG